MPDQAPALQSAREQVDAGRLVAWASAWLAGLVSYDEALSQVTRDRLHQVSGLPEQPEPVPLGWALSELRADRASAVRLVLPVPGDLTGLPGPEPLRRAGLASGAVAVAACPSPGLGLALVPQREERGNDAEGRTVTVAWSAFATEPLVSSPYLPLSEADQDLTAALRETTESLLSLDVARWRPELGEALADLRRSARSGRDEGSSLPPGYPPRARLLLSRADQLGRVVALATADDPGASISTSEVIGRRAALTSLERAVRRARLAAYNCFGVEPG